MTPLEIAGVIFGSMFLIIIIPIVIGLLVRIYWEIIVDCYKVGRGLKKYKLVKLKIKRKE